MKKLLSIAALIVSLALACIAGVIVFVAVNDLDVRRACHCDPGECKCCGGCSCGRHHSASQASKSDPAQAALNEQAWDYWAKCMFNVRYYERMKIDNGMKGKYQAIADEIKPFVAKAVGGQERDASEADTKRWYLALDKLDLLETDPVNLAVAEEAQADVNEMAWGTRDWKEAMRIKAARGHADKTRPVQPAHYAVANTVDFDEFVALRKDVASLRQRVRDLELLNSCAVPAYQRNSLRYRMRSRAMTMRGSGVESRPLMVETIDPPKAPPAEEPEAEQNPESDE